jgi:hypothetical protein
MKTNILSGSALAAAAIALALNGAAIAPASAHVTHKAHHHKGHCGAKAKCKSHKNHCNVKNRCHSK